MKFEASRLSDGNKLFPAEIIIEPIGITLKVPGFFGGKEQTIPFHLISSVKLKTPFIGFSTIIIYSVGWDIITASGFTEADVTAIKRQIEIGQENYKKQRAANSITSNNFVENNQTNSVVSQANSKTNLSKWQKELTQLSELTWDEVISEEEFESQKSILLLKLSQDSSLVMTDALRMLKELEEEEIITEFEFNETKQNLMKPKPSENNINTQIIEVITPQAIEEKGIKEEPSESNINTPIIEAVRPQINNQEPSSQGSSSQQNTTPQNANSESIITEQIEKLIEMALMDGVLTEKEKEILFKKAEAAGIDFDEFEMILDAKLFEKQQSIKATAPSVAAPKSDKFGEIKKCPSCGAIVGAFQGICSDCGHEFTNIDSVSSVQNLYKELMRVENEERNRPKKDKPTSLLDRIGGEIDTDDDDDEYRITEIIYKRKINVVSVFPVPNSKADILEFMIMAVAEGGKKIGGFFSQMSNEEKTYIKTWRAKAEQVVGKARFSLKDDKKLLDEITEYARKLEIIK